IPASADIYTLSLHDALPILVVSHSRRLLLLEGAASSAISARPRVEQAVEKVGEGVDRDEDDADHQRAAEHRIHVGVLQRIGDVRSEEHTSELQSRENLVCRL